MWFRHVEKITLTIDNTTLDCARFGTGDKTLILLPGVSFQNVKSAALPLAYRYRIFAREYTVYVFDKKTVIPEGYTVRDMAADAACAMEQLYINKADIFGVSLGGMIAQYLAMDYPHRVNKLVLGVTASRSNEVMGKVIHDWIQMAEADAYGEIVIDMFEKMYSAAYNRKYRWLFPILRRIGRPKDLSRFVAMVRTCLTCDAYPELRKITCQALVIGGGKDYVVTGQASYEIAEALGCEIYMYDELGHAAYDEATDYNERVLRFLKG